jgi:hypothetical protein
MKSPGFVVTSLPEEESLPSGLTRGSNFELARNSGEGLRSNERALPFTRRIRADLSLWER